MGRSFATKRLQKQHRRGIRIKKGWVFNQTKDLKRLSLKTDEAVVAIHQVKTKPDPVYRKEKIWNPRGVIMGSGVGMVQEGK
jgi:hypothetical protein